MADHHPLVSIGLPVYNGEQHVRRALDSLLAQDYENFELIISDNASTDGTPAICQEYAARDRRIQYHRNEVNKGSVWNFNRAFELSSGKYFAWAGHDDWWESAFISKCAAALEKMSDAVLCYMLAEYEDQDGQHLDIMDSDISTYKLNRLERLHTVILRLRSAEAIFGLIRADALRQTTLTQDCFGSDKSLIYQLAILGHIIKVPEVLHHYRLVSKSWEQYAIQIGKTTGSRQPPPTPKASLTTAVLQAILHLPVPPLQKPLLMFDALYCLRRRYTDRLHQEFAARRRFWFQRFWPLRRTGGR
ncbi:MAG: glycosyltransferase family 2 protein [Anaerolineales bacterium]|nr:glycosyltransferase family 2 protein [Anaerolineales bacterium]